MPASAPEGRSAEISITLSPGEGTEIKLVMQEGAEARFEWTANGGLLNYDTHGDGGGQSISYEKGRGVPGSEDRYDRAHAAKPQSVPVPAEPDRFLRSRGCRRRSSEP